MEFGYATKDRIKTKAVDNHAKDACTRTFSTVMGLLCAHEICEMERPIALASIHHHSNLHFLDTGTLIDKVSASFSAVQYANPSFDKDLKILSYKSRDFCQLNRPLTMYRFAKLQKKIF